MILLIDNYDSFTWNLVHFLGDLGAACDVRRNDALTVEQALALKPEAIIFSPGPCDPDKAGISLNLVRENRDIPMLGICLGHEAIGQAYGGAITRAPAPVHGKLSAIKHDDQGVFAGLAQNFAAARYHSLVIDQATLPDMLEACAWTQDGLLMGVRHKKYNVHGVQFHPESIATENGHRLLKNFLKLAGVSRKKMDEERNKKNG